MLSQGELVFQGSVGGTKTLRESRVRIGVSDVDSAVSTPQQTRMGREEGRCFIWRRIQLAAVMIARFVEAGFRPFTNVTWNRILWKKCS